MTKSKMAGLSPAIASLGICCAYFRREIGM
jgi:hypothetical protein